MVKWGFRESMIFRWIKRLTEWWWILGPLVSQQLSAVVATLAKKFISRIYLFSEIYICYGEGFAHLRIVKAGMLVDEFVCIRLLEGLPDWGKVDTKQLNMAGKIQEPYGRESHLVCLGEFSCINSWPPESLNRQRISI